VNTVYVNGEYTPAEKASISIFDRGFLFADSIYEVIPVYKGRIFFLEKHLKRLRYGLTETKIHCDIADREFKELFIDLIDKNKLIDGQIYLQITRGNTFNRNHDISRPMRASVIAFTMNIPYLSFESAQNGLHAVTLEDTRWMRCDIKTTALLGNILLNDQAISHGADTTLLIRNHHITESAAANIFIVNDKNQIVTPPKDNQCLPGITRDIIVNLANQAGFIVLEQAITEQVLFNANEIMITSTTKEIQPIIKINDKSIADGKAGPTWCILFRLFQDLKSSHG
jgi:D-alanine transaminase